MRAQHDRVSTYFELLVTNQIPGPRVIEDFPPRQSLAPIKRIAQMTFRAINSYVE